MTALSADFTADIKLLMEQKHKKAGYLFLKPGQIATRAWYLASGFIVALNIDRYGTEVVERIYFSSDVVTDLTSFFTEVPVHFKFVGVGDVTVLEIKREGVRKLEKHPETQELIQHVAFLENNRSDEIRQINRLTAEDQVMDFLEKYPVAGLPEQYCASYLNIPLAQYLSVLHLLAINKYVVPKASLAVKKEEVHHPVRIAKDIMDYLSGNYTKPDIGNTRKIAGSFNMTSVTLNRMFIKSFGLTVHKYITQQRMKNAEETLKSGTATVGEVALAVGYKNIFHFSKAFKSYFGYTPKQGKQQKHK